MVRKEKENSHTLSSLGQDIRRLYDDVAEFHECCARLCDTASSSTSSSGGAGQDSSIKTLSCWMTERMDGFKAELKRLQQKVDTQASPRL